MPDPPVARLTPDPSQTVLEDRAPDAHVFAVTAALAQQDTPWRAVLTQLVVMNQHHVARQQRHARLRWWLWGLTSLCGVSLLLMAVFLWASI